MEHSLKDRYPYKKRRLLIITDIYHKPADTQQSHHFKSHPPKNCIKSIPYTLACRIHTIIIDKNLKKMPQRTAHKPSPDRLGKGINPILLPPAMDK